MKTLISYGWCSSLRSDCSYSAGVKATTEQPSSAPFPLFYFVFPFIAHFSLVNLPYFLSAPLVFVLLFFRPSLRPIVPFSSDFPFISPPPPPTISVPSLCLYCQRMQYVLVTYCIVGGEVMVAVDRCSTSRKR